jgi:hypothetical protein
MQRADPKMHPLRSKFASTDSSPARTAVNHGNRRWFWRDLPKWRRSIWRYFGVIRREGLFPAAVGNPLHCRPQLHSRESRFSDRMEAFFPRAVAEVAV